jgi:hypothetical protein
MNRRGAKNAKDGKTKAITTEAQRHRGNAEKSINRKGAKAQRKAAKNF